jgi:hypothetical protein
MGVQQRARLMVILAADYMEGCRIVIHACPLVNLWKCDCKAERIAVLVDSTVTNKVCFCVDDACLPRYFISLSYLSIMILCLLAPPFLLPLLHHYHQHPTLLGTIWTRIALAGYFLDKRGTFHHWPGAATHDTVIQHHHDRHLSLHQIAYLRSALTTSRKSLFEVIHRFPTVAHSGELQFRVNYRPRHTVTHPPRSIDDCCAASRLDGSVLHGPPTRAMLRLQHECL